MRKKRSYPLFFLAVISIGFGCGASTDDYEEGTGPNSPVSVGGTTSLVSMGGATSRASTGTGGTAVHTRTGTGTGGSAVYASTVNGTGGTISTGGSMSSSGKAAATTLTGSSSCAASQVIRLIGNQIVDTSGTPFVARGPEIVVASTDQTKSVDAIAATGANAMRMLLTLDAANGMTPAGFDALISRAVSHQMIVWISLYSWDTSKNFAISDALGGGNFYALTAPSGFTACSSKDGTACYLAVWSRQWLKDLVAKYKGHVIIDAMQEFIGGSDSDVESGRIAWANAAKANISFFRSAGYIEPLEIMSNFQGRDLGAIIEKGAEIRAADTVTIGTDHQTMFGWQAYWATDWYKGWQGGLLLGGNNTITGAQAIHQIVTAQTFPIEVGVDNYGGDTSSEYRSEIDQASSDGVSWLWWSWKDGDNNVECPTDGAACQAYVTTAANGFAGAIRSACGL